MSSVPTNLSYQQQPQVYRSDEYPQAVPVNYYPTAVATPQGVQYVVYVPQNSVPQTGMYPAMPQIYPAMPQTSTVPVQEPVIKETDATPVPSPSPVALKCRKSRSILLILAILSLAVSIFFFVYTPCAAYSKSYITYCTNGCYSYSTYAAGDIFRGFGYTAGAMFMIQSVLLIASVATKNVKALKIILIISAVLFGLFTVTELAATATTGQYMYYLNWDPMTSHIAATLVSFASWIASLVVYHKNFVSGSYATTSAASFNSPSMASFNSLLVASSVISIITLVFGLIGFILVAVFGAWLYAAVAAILYTGSGVFGLIASIRLRQNPQAAAKWFRINIVLGWMLAGTALLVSTTIVMLIYIPFGSAIAAFLGVFPGANAVISMMIVHKLDKMSATPVEIAPTNAEPAQQEDESEKVQFLPTQTA